MDYAMCVQDCPKALDCQRHHLSGSIAASYWQSYMSFHPEACISQMPVGNPERQMQTALVRFLEQLLARKYLRINKTGTWEQGFNEQAKAYSAQAIEIIQQMHSNHDLATDLREAMEFYSEPVEDPEMGPYFLGAQHAARAVGIAIITLILDEPDFAAYREKIDRIFTQIAE